MIQTRVPGSRPQWLDDFHPEALETRRIRVRCGDCGTIVFEAAWPDGTPADMPTCLNRIKPGAGPCERDFARERDLAADARRRA